MRNLRSMRMALLGRARSEVGVTIVEFALSLHLLLAMVFGILAVGSALYTYNFVSDAAREGARYAIVRGSGCTVAGCSATNASIQSYIAGLGYPGILASNLTVATTWTPNNSSGSVVQVKVTYNFPYSVPFVSSSTLSMTSTSQMVMSQ